MKRSWTLHPRQRVTASLHRRQIYFQHYISKTAWCGLVLSWQQFQNMNDVLRNWKTLIDIRRHPLGEGVWLCNYNPVICLQGKYSYFKFYRDSWYKYINSIRREVTSFFRYDFSKHQNYQYHATNANGSRHRPRSCVQLIHQHKTLSRSPRNVGDENEQRKKNAAISKRHNSNPRCDFSFRRAVNALRTKTSPEEEDREDEELSSDATDFEEHGDICTIE